MVGARAAAATNSKTPAAFIIYICLLLRSHQSLRCASRSQRLPEYREKRGGDMQVDGEDREQF